MAEHVYECMFLLDSNRYARDPAGSASGIDAMVEQCGGTVMVSRMWNEQKLAYAIDGHKKGTYWLTYFRIDSTRLGELNRKCQLNETVLRQLVLKVDPRLADTLVQHASGSTPVAEVRATAETVAVATQVATGGAEVAE